MTAIFIADFQAVKKLFCNFFIKKYCNFKKGSIFALVIKLIQINMKIEETRKKNERMLREAKTLLKKHSRMRAYEMLAEKYNVCVTYVCRIVKKAGI